MHSEYPPNEKRNTFDVVIMKETACEWNMKIILSIREMVKI